MYNEALPQRRRLVLANLVLPMFYFPKMSHQAPHIYLIKLINIIYYLINLITYLFVPAKYKFPFSEIIAALRGPIDIFLTLKPSFISTNDSVSFRLSNINLGL